MDRLFAKSSETRCRPMTTSFPCDDASASTRSGESIISKISLTPWIILTSPLSRTRRPFNRWVSNGAALGKRGSSQSHSTDLNQRSTFWTWSGDSTGTGIVIVEMVWPRLAISHHPMEVPMLNILGPSGCGLYRSDPCPRCGHKSSGQEGTPRAPELRPSP